MTNASGSIVLCCTKIVATSFPGLFPMVKATKGKALGTRLRL